MGTKVIKIEIPENYVIDKEKSTSNRIVFKEKSYRIYVEVINNKKWLYINADGEEFYLDIHTPDYQSNLIDIRNFLSKHPEVTLPSVKQLKVIYKYLEIINHEIYNTIDGYAIYGSVYWSNVKHTDNTAIAVNLNKDGNSIPLSTLYARALARFILA